MMTPLQIWTGVSHQQSSSEGLARQWMRADRYRFVVDLACSNGRRDERNEVVDFRTGYGSFEVPVADDR